MDDLPPKITPFSFARDLNVGDRTSIQCVIGTGDLPLTFTWLKDGQPLQAAGPAGMKSGHISRDSGVSVSGGLSGTGDVAATGTGSHLMSAATSINYANAHAHPSHITNDDGSSGGEGGAGIVTIRQNDDFTSALSITSVTRAQSGTYTCRVQNDAATVSHSAQLRVNVPPRISPFSFEDEITEGMRTQLMCSSSQGDQPFNITWLKDGVVIQSGGLESAILSSNESPKSASSKPPDPSLTINEYAPFSSILSIHNVTSRHNGNYTCRVTNRAGSVEYAATLSVSVPPRWIIKPSDQDAILGNPVSIRCQADGFPVPTVQWKQSIGDSGDYRELSYNIGNGNSQSVIETHSNGTLSIPKVAREHEGSYLCQANNGIGAGLSTLIKLKVHVGPSVTVSKKQITVRRGDRVTLRCEADGDQPLDISWRGKSNRIDPSFDVRYHIKDSPLSRGVVSELTILQTILSDRGEYSCIASNTYGHDRGIIYLQVQEPPNFPVNLHVTDLGSRSVTLAWSPNDQDSVAVGVNNRDSQPISNYILQYKKAGDVWHEGNNQKLLPGEKTTAQIGSLRPAQAYHFRLYAENHLGTSAPSDILLVQTDAEAPNGRPQDVSAEPLGPQQLLITWRPPERDTWNGELLGYTIAYQKHGSSDNFQNFTKVSSLGGEGLNDFRLTGLEKYTQYAVTVSAFNVKGDGPPSEVALGHTLEDAPSAAPQSVTCIALTAQNIQISWQAPPKENHHGVIQGYKVLYEPGNFDSEYGTRETKITSALSTVLHGLQPFTNYSVQSLAFTRAGEGVVSPTVSCTTEEAVPDAPERVKSVVNSESSVIISWLPPRRPNGIVTKYNVYIRILDKGQELKILKEVLPAQNRHFEAKDLSTRETYEAWVTASTRVGQGPSTPVIKLVPSSSVPAAIISFSQTLSISWRVDMKLPCLFVGSPKPNSEWKVLNARSKKHFRLEVSNDNTLTLRNIQRSHEGNYSCIVRNAIGSDHIVYQLFVQVPPSAPIIAVIGTTSNSVSLQWRVEDIGGAPLRGFTLTYRKEFSDWEEIQLDRRVNSQLLENLQCGTRYQFTIVTFNKIGTSNTSPIEIAKTKGSKPIAPGKHSLIRPNITSALVELSSWQDGGCPIQYFSIEFKRYGVANDWIIVSSRIETHTRYTIGDLEAGIVYSLRITAHNNAGSTIKEYSFETLRYNGISTELDQSDLPEVSNPRQLFTRNVESLRPSVNEGKDIQHREQYYGTMRKSCQQSPGDSVVALERIPEYSEDIYPYATFHLPEHENQSANIPLNRKGIQPMYDPRGGDDNTLSSTGVKVKRSVSASVGSGNISLGGGECSHTSTEKRHKRRSKAIKSESEEYDSLNSDSDLSGERIRDDNRSSHTDASNQMDNSGCNKSILPKRKKDSTSENSRTSNGLADTASEQQQQSSNKGKQNKPLSFKSRKSFFQIIIPTKIITPNPQSAIFAPRPKSAPTASNSKGLTSDHEKPTRTKTKSQAHVPPHQYVHLLQRPRSEIKAAQKQQPARTFSPTTSPSHRIASSSKHEHKVTSTVTKTTTTADQTNHQPISNSRSSPNALVILKSSGSGGSGSSDSMRQASDECAQDTANNTNMSGSLSGKIRAKNTDNNSSSGNSIANEFQSSPKDSVPAPNIVQSGSYVEILKQAAAAANQQTTAEQRLISHTKGTAIASSPLACHNKSYGDFLTITPRRKGKLLGNQTDNVKHITPSGMMEAPDNYRHHLPHSIEPLHLLGIPNENMSTFFDYRAMETLSNADTLAIGSTMATHLYPNKSKAGYETSSTLASQTTTAVPDEYQHIISEKNLSPPSAFCDNISINKI
uniref:Down syndrome cell adhesion molecule n=1 Tax=Glossina palpalis gambiensis TaxID=67801 RepID=A0A1B0BQH6_9MUSC